MHYIHPVLRLGLGFTNQCWRVISTQWLQSHPQNCCSLQHSLPPNPSQHSLQPNRQHTHDLLVVQWLRTTTTTHQQPTTLRWEQEWEPTPTTPNNNLTILPERPGSSWWTPTTTTTTTTSQKRQQRRFSVTAGKNLAPAAEPSANANDNMGPAHALFACFCCASKSAFPHISAHLWSVVQFCISWQICTCSLCVRSLCKSAFPGQSAHHRYSFSSLFLSIIQFFSSPSFFYKYSIDVRVGSFTFQQLGEALALLSVSTCYLFPWFDAVKFISTNFGQN